MEKSTEVAEEEFQRLIASLPKSRGWIFDTQYQYEGFWYPQIVIQGILNFKNKHYFPIVDDEQLETGKLCSQSSSSPGSSFLLVSYPKSGTTWLKSLLFAITSRAEFPPNSSTHPLLTTNPHECFTFVESDSPTNNINIDHSNPAVQEVEDKSHPLYSTHLPFISLPDSIKSSVCRIVYVFRDPKDVLISLLHFSNQCLSSNDQPSFISMEEAVDLFCEGKSFYGPYWDHVLTYWEESLKNTGRILFVTYEELKTKPIDCLKKLANFIGQPFSTEEEKAGVLENIVHLCSFNKMRNLEVNQPQSLNKTASKIMKLPNSLFFRKGEVGDHQNYLTPEMICRIDNITKHKWGDIIGVLELSSLVSEQN